MPPTSGFPPQPHPREASTVPFPIRAEWTVNFLPSSLNGSETPLEGEGNLVRTMPRSGEERPK